MKNPFIPMKLPIDSSFIDYNELAIVLSEASKNLGILNAKMENTNLEFTYVANHMLKLESLYSTRIEGTQTTIDAIYEADMNMPKENNVDINEVFRYYKALNLAIKGAAKSQIDIKLIKEIHRTLLSGNVRKNSNFIAGLFRQQQNRVGDHIPPVAKDVEMWMGNLERYINNDYGYEDKLPAIIKAAIIHAQFETIHPFPDGNGRVGRVLIPIYLYKQGEINFPYFFLSQELERNSLRYYSFLQGTRSLTKQGFTEWISFFLESIVNQTNKEIKFIDDINDLYSASVNTIKNAINSANSKIVVKSIFKNPIFTINTIYKDTGINKGSLRTYINTLVDSKILYKSPQKRNIRYYFMNLLDLIKMK